MLTLRMVVCMLDGHFEVSLTLPRFPVFLSLGVVTRHEKVIEYGSLNRPLDRNMSLMSEHDRSLGHWVVNHHVQIHLRKASLCFSHIGIRQLARARSIPLSTGGFNKN